MFLHLSETERVSVCFGELKLRKGRKIYTAFIDGFQIFFHQNIRCSVIFKDCLDRKMGILHSLQVFEEYVPKSRNRGSSLNRNNTLFHNVIVKQQPSNFVE